MSSSVFSLMRRCFLASLATSASHVSSSSSSSLRRRSISSWTLVLVPWAVSSASTNSAAIASQRVRRYSRAIFMGSTWLQAMIMRLMPSFSGSSLTSFSSALSEPLGLFTASFARSAFSLNLALDFSWRSGLTTICCICCSFAIRRLRSPFSFLFTLSRSMRSCRASSTRLLYVSACSASRSTSKRTTS